jgi:NAD(P)-dependent dehydrogenase (short-subunit alcohol dehydrogenase family)
MLAIDWARHDVLINAVVPGYVNTAMSVVDGENELESDRFREMYVDGWAVTDRARREPKRDRCSHRLARATAEHLCDGLNGHCRWWVDSHRLTRGSKLRHWQGEASRVRK